MKVVLTVLITVWIMSICSEGRHDLSESCECNDEIGAQFSKDGEICCGEKGNKQCCVEDEHGRGRNIDLFIYLGVMGTILLSIGVGCCCARIRNKHTTNQGGHGQLDARTSCVTEEETWTIATPPRHTILPS